MNKEKTLSVAKKIQSAKKQHMQKMVVGILVMQAMMLPVRPPLLLVMLLALPQYSGIFIAMELELFC